MKTSRVVLLLSSLVLVAACGTKGPLVMPDGSAPKKAPTPVELPQSADAARDEGADGGESADAVKPSEPPTDE